MSNNSVRVVARIEALPHSVNEARAILTTLIEPTRKEAGVHPLRIVAKPR